LALYSFLYTILWYYQKYATVQFEGGREILREIEYYNLDVIISVGYRVKSPKDVKFRQLATNVLKSYIQNGYVVNSDKITHLLLP